MSRWMRYLVIFLLGGLTAFRINFPLPHKATIPKKAVSTTTVRIKNVIDGDTIELEDGRRIRYIGIDTPEMGDERTTNKCFAKEATEENRRLVDGKTVRIEGDVSETDKYGRLLRYVYVGDVFVNDSLVRQGFARIDTVPPDVAHREQFLDAEREARGQKRGLWNVCVR